MTKTEHYQLNQWDAADSVRREDFNADNARIDAALGALKDAAEAETAAREEAVAGAVVVGTYQGMAPKSDPTAKGTVTLGFRPRFLLVREISYQGSSASGDYGWTPVNLGIAAPGCGHYAYGSSLLIQVTEDGFSVGGANGKFNAPDVTYLYLAVR